MEFPYSTHADALNKIQAWFVENTRLGIPVDFIRDLTFECNRIIQTYDYKPYTWQQSSFLLEGCRKVKIQKKTIEARYMKKKDITIGKGQKLNISFSEKIDSK